MFSMVFGLAAFSYILYWIMFKASAESFTGFYNETALILLLAGPPAVILVSRSFSDVFMALKSVMSMTFINAAKETSNIANQMTALSQAARQEGLGSLVQFRSKIKHPLFRDGITLILNGFTSEEIKHNLTARINSEQTRLGQAAGLFEGLGKLSPAMGLLGTIVGLIQMLSNLSDPTKIGPGMAVSLLATLYGLILGNAVYLPIADKIQSQAEKEAHLNTMIMEGIILLKEKKSNVHLRDMVNTYSDTHVGTRGQASTDGATADPQKKAG
jgi:chemotaxis protein MotA